VKDGCVYQQNDIIEWYKLSRLEEQDEGFTVCKRILEVGVLHFDAQGHEAILVGFNSSISLLIHLTVGQ
jgi:hypothetical protein